jgi:hypothetical protein
MPLIGSKTNSFDDFEVNSSNNALMESVLEPVKDYLEKAWFQKLNVKDGIVCLNFYSTFSSKEDIKKAYDAVNAIARRIQV